jgi:mannose-6-phosphate isomerase-like protein (cupin superfamily)
MSHSEPVPISIDEAIAVLSFLPDRTPLTTSDESKDAFARLADYRDGAVFVGHWAGNSEWERHAVGDEIVMVLDGETTIFFRDGDYDQPGRLTAGELVIVPEGTWHRFETPESVKILSVTPQPTDHSPHRPPEPSPS